MLGGPDGLRILVVRADVCGGGDEARWYPVW
jgi:hypothetical protein